VIDPLVQPRERLLQIIQMRQNVARRERLILVNRLIPMLGRDERGPLDRIPLRLISLYAGAALLPAGPLRPKEK
jgi:hypothetical protein